MFLIYLIFPLTLASSNVISYQSCDLLSAGFLYKNPFPFREPSMDVNELKSFKIKELTKLSQDLGVKSVSGLNKQELIALILKAQAEKDGVLYSKGVLEVMSDGYGFLRSPDFNYLPGSNDIYVSPSQIKRFRLRTGHLISGQIRPPKSKERFHALLKIDLVNDHPF